MNNKPNKEQIIIIVTIITMLLIFTGITYSYFTANNPKGSTAQIISETGRMLITYDDGTDSIVPVTGIVPSNAILVNKTFTLTGTNTTEGMGSSDGLDMSYNVGVEYLSTFSDGMIHYYIKEIDRPTTSNVTTEYTGETDKTVQGNDTYTGYSHGTFKYGNRYTEMVSGKFPASLNDQTIKFNLIIQFPDNNENQDSEKGKTFNGKIIINNENNKVSQVIADLYDNTEKDENGITIDGLQKDGTGEYNIQTLSTTNKKYTVNLKKPAGVREMSTTKITVNMVVDNIVTKEIPDVRINSINLASGLKVQALSKEDSSVTVIISGSESVIKDIDSSKINAYIDLADLSVGEHEVEIKVTGNDNKITYTSKTKKVKVRISAE